MTGVLSSFFAYKRLIVPCACNFCQAYFQKKRHILHFGRFPPGETAFFAPAARRRPPFASPPPGAAAGLFPHGFAHEKIFLLFPPVLQHFSQFPHRRDRTPSAAGAHRIWRMPFRVSDFYAKEFFHEKRAVRMRQQRQFLPDQKLRLRSHRLYPRSSRPSGSPGLSRAARPGGSRRYARRYGAHWSCRRGRRGWSHRPHRPRRRHRSHGACRRSYRPHRPRRRGGCCRPHRAHWCSRCCRSHRPHRRSRRDRPHRACRCGGCCRPHRAYGRNRCDRSYRTCRCGGCCRSHRAHGRSRCCRPYRTCRRGGRGRSYRAHGPCRDRHAGGGCHPGHRHRRHRDPVQPAPHQPGSCGTAAKSLI